MRALLQRTTGARVRVGGEVVGEIGPGLVVLLGVGPDDAVAVADDLARKAAELRIFRDDEGRTNRSLLDVGGEALVVSQFTLLGDTSKGNRPSFTEAAPPEEAQRLYEGFCAELRALGVPVATGVFGARMPFASRGVRTAMRVSSKSAVSPSPRSEAGAITASRPSWSARRAASS